MKIRNKPLFDVVASKSSQLYLEQTDTKRYNQKIIDLINNIEDYTFSEDKHIALINELHRNGLFREAIRTCCDAISKDPFNWIFYFLKGYNNLFIEQITESASNLEIASRLNPMSFQVRLYSGISCFLLGNYSKSNYAFEQALDLAETFKDKCEVISWYWIFSLRQSNESLADNLLNSIDFKTKNSCNGVYECICQFYKTNDYDFLEDLAKYDQLSNNPHKYLLSWYEILRGNKNKGYLLLTECTEINIFSIQSVAARKDLKKTYIKWTLDRFEH